VSLEPPIQPDDFDELSEFQEKQAARIRIFLGRLAEEDDLLRAYFKDRVAVLQGEVQGERLIGEDVALLLSDDYSRVYEVMSKGSKPQRWLVIWIR
jgi:hypothetical protein